MDRESFLDILTDIVLSDQPHIIDSTILTSDPLPPAPEPVAESEKTKLRVVHKKDKYGNNLLDSR